jgi:hypothetical protein
LDDTTSRYPSISVGALSGIATPVIAHPSLAIQKRKPLLIAEASKNVERTGEMSNFSVQELKLLEALPAI